MWTNPRRYGPCFFRNYCWSQLGWLPQVPLGRVLPGKQCVLALSNPIICWTGTQAVGWINWCKNSCFWTKVYCDSTSRSALLSSLRSCTSIAACWPSMRLKPRAESWELLLRCRECSEVFPDDSPQPPYIVLTEFRVEIINQNALFDASKACSWQLPGSLIEEVLLSASKWNGHSRQFPTKSQAFPVNSDFPVVETTDCVLDSEDCDATLWQPVPQRLGTDFWGTTSSEGFKSQQTVKPVSIWRVIGGF